MRRVINKIPIRDQVKSILMEQILSGELKPGTRLKELHIAKDLSVSQASVREALRALEPMGFVDTIPNTGTSVKEFQLCELIEVYQVREALELHAVKLALNSIKEDADWDLIVDLIETCLNNMQEALSRNDRLTYAEHNTEFHRIFLKMSGNNRILTMWESLAVQSRVMQTMFSKNIVFDSVVELHKPILVALKKRDAEQVCSAISNHYEYIINHHRSNVEEVK